MENDKAWGLFRLRITDALEPFRGYGYDVYIPEVAAQIERLTRTLIDSIAAAKEVKHNE